MGNTQANSQNVDQRANESPEFEDQEDIQTQRQQDLLRRERLAQLERQQGELNYSSPPKQKKLDFDSMCQEEQISYVFEQILQVSINDDTNTSFYSLVDIKKDLIDPKFKKPLLNKQNVQDFVIYEVLQSKLKVFFSTHEERVKYIFTIIKKCTTNRNNLLHKSNLEGNQSSLGMGSGSKKSSSQTLINESSIKLNNQDSLISVEDYDEIIETCFNYMITLLTQFESFDIDDIEDEKANDIFDTKNVLLDAFYNNFNRYSLITFDEVMNRLSKHDEFENIMNSIFKRIYNSMREKGSIENMDTFFNSIDRMKQLFTKDYILDYFLNQSQLFYSDNLKYGIYLEGNTIFGLMLSLTTFPNEWKQWVDRFNIQTNPPNLKEAQLKIFQDSLNIRKQINDFHERLYHLLNSIARKRKDRLVFWIEKVMDMNKGILKTYHTHEHCSNPGFLFNFLRILLHFSYPLTSTFAKMQESMNKLDLSIITEPTGFFKFFDRIQIYDKEKHQKEILQTEQEKSEQKEIVIDQDEEAKQNDKSKENNKSNEQNVQFISQIYRFVMASIHLNTPLFKSLKQFQDKLHKASHLQFSGHHEQMNFKMKQKEKIAYNILIEDPQFYQMITKFFELEILFCWKLNNQKVDNECVITELQTQYTQTYAQLPFFFIEDINEFTSLALMINPKTIQDNKSSFSRIIDCQIIMMGYRQWCNNHHFRQKIIEIFSMMIGFDKNKELSPSILLHNSNVFKQYMIPGLLQVFIEIEKSTDGHHHQHQLNEKFIFRYHFCKIFTYLLENQHSSSQKIYSKQLINLTTEKKIMFLEFANLYFNDLIFLLDIISNQMCKYFHFQTLNRAHINQISYMQKEAEAKQSQQQVRKNSQYLTAYYKNIETLSLYTDDIFLQDEVKSKLTNFINISFLKILTYHHLDQLTESAQKELGFDLKMVVICIVKLYIQYSNYETFLEGLVDDERVFDIEAFKTSVLKLEKLKILPENLQTEFNKLVQRIYEVYEEKQRREALLYAEVPDKYLDPILSQLMKDPVKLPKSEVVIDRVTIVKHLLNDKTDPFTRDTLQESDLIPLPELKIEIEEFVKQQLLQKKLKDQAKNEDQTPENQMEEQKEDKISSQNALESVMVNETNVEDQFNLSEIRSEQEIISVNGIDESSQRIQTQQQQQQQQQQ